MLPLLYEAFVYSLDFYLRKQIEKKGSCNLTKKRGSKSRFGCSVAHSSETKNRSSGSRGIGPALLVRFALTSGPGFGTSKRVPLTRCGSYGSMVVFSTTLSILSGVLTTPRVRTNRTDSTATFPPPHVGRSRGLRSEKLCKKKVQACAGAAKPAIGGTPHQASCFSLLGPDAGAARDTDKCETHARTHSAPHDERRVQRTIHLTTATACWPASPRGGLGRVASRQLPG